ncbi:MAG: hypothetical protein QOK35_1735, partial [Pseudonocardiales bacterium]|nr:hypothetical protein [Pseudonocardiales bacterium]
ATIATAAAAREGTGPTTPSAWTDPSARLRRPLTVGPGAWRTSTWPR